MEQKPQARKEILNVSDVAPALGVTPSRVYQMIHAGELPSVKVGKHGVRIPARAFAEWLDGKNAEGRASLRSASLRPASLSLADVITALPALNPPTALTLQQSMARLGEVLALLGTDGTQTESAASGFQTYLDRRYR